MTITQQGWIGFDFDGTLVTYDSGSYPAIGAPVPSMIQLLKEYLAAGYECRIITARAATAVGRMAVREFMFQQVGEILAVTDRKDFQMLLQYDDRAIAVEPNTGRLKGWRI